MAIGKNEVRHIAKLSRLEFSEEKEQAFIDTFNSMLDSFTVISKINTEGVNPTAHVLQKQNVLREDVAKDCMDADLLLSNAPDREDSAYLVPKVVE